MPPTQLHLIRHAQGYHNLSPLHHNIRDPLLTPVGEQQCLKLADQIDDIQSIDCIVSSPSRRTLYTALLTFKSVLKAKPDLKIIALPELQETSTLPCDVGSSVDELRLEFEGRQVDLSHVHAGWNDKLEGPFTPLSSRVMSRCRKVRKFLQCREQGNVAAVTHGGLLHFLTNDWQGALSGCGTGWSNCEYRSYTFFMTNNDNIANATIVETPTSLAHRMHTEKMLSSEEQIQLAAVVQASWAADGYIIVDTTDDKDTIPSVKEAENGTNHERAEQDVIADLDATLTRNDEKSGEQLELKRIIKAKL